jgi:uncharacterized protein (DUF362 family)
MSDVTVVEFKSYSQSVPAALELAGAGAILPKGGIIILKPNLTNSSPPPVTTSVKMVEAVYNYCVKRTKAKIIIGEGCGKGTTFDIFEELGYTALAEKYKIELADFNEADSVLLENKNALQLKRLYLPKIVLDAFIISIPVLKDHSFTDTTVAMKNMFGLAPAKYYKNGWNKSKLHSPSTDKSIVDICTYKSIGFCIVDASVALAGMHLAGTEKKIGKIIAGADCVAVDSVASQMLGHNPQNLEYLVMADGLLGDMKNINILKG